MKYGYARVSSENQNIEIQIQAIVEAGVERQNIFLDVSSGVKTERKGFDCLMREIHEGDTLYVWKTDRAARNVSHFLQLFEFFECREINFKSILEPAFDTTIPNSVYLFYIFKVLRQLEKKLLSETVIVGLDSARKRGRNGGRKSGLSHEAAQKARIAEELYTKSNYSITEICDFLKIGSKRTLYAYLRSRDVKIGYYKKND